MGKRWWRSVVGWDRGAALTWTRAGGRRARRAALKVVTVLRGGCAAYGGEGPSLYAKLHSLATHSAPLHSVDPARS